MAKKSAKKENINKNSVILMYAILGGTVFLLGMIAIMIFLK